MNLCQHSLLVILNPLQLSIRDPPPLPLQRFPLQKELWNFGGDITTASPQQTFGGQESSPELDTDSDHAPCITLIIRRGHCLSDLIKAFKDPDILGSEIYIKMRLPNGQLEEGKGIGVFRDCITEFWMEFYER